MKNIIRIKGVCATHTFKGIIMCPKWFECYEDGERKVKKCPELKPLFPMIQEIILNVLSHEELVDNDREILFDAIKEKYCIHCGKADPACQCRADENNRIEGRDGNYV